MDRVRNPSTGRYIIPGKTVYNTLIRNGYVHDRQTNQLVKAQINRLVGNDNLLDSDIPDIGVEPLKPTTFNKHIGNGNLLDKDVPDIGVEPLKPTAFQSFTNLLVKNASKMAGWLWKLSKNNNKIVDWISTKKDQIINKILPKKVVELIELSKNSKYTESCDDEQEYSKISGKEFKNNLIVHELSIRNDEDPIIQMKLLDERINKLLLNELKLMNGLKFNIGMEILFEKSH